MFRLASKAIGIPIFLQFSIDDNETIKFLFGILKSTKTLSHKKVKKCTLSS